MTRGEMVARRAAEHLAGIVEQMSTNGISRHTILEAAMMRAERMVPKIREYNRVNLSVNACIDGVPVDDL